MRKFCQSFEHILRKITETLNKNLKNLEAINKKKLGTSKEFWKILYKINKNNLQNFKEQNLQKL